MIKINRFFKINVLAVLLVGFLTISVSGKEPDFSQVAEEMIGSSGITWMPKVNYSQLVLTISRPDGSFFRKTFDSGSSPYADLSSIFGDSYMDGYYNYELLVIPVLERKVRGAKEGFVINRKIGGQFHNKGLTQSGSFLVQGGAIVTKNMYEPEAGGHGSISNVNDGLSSAQDQVILDDLIVDGSACIGFDCVNGENFGFDTIRLKENNLRIKFEDTSNSGSFPSNDWQITANDSASGGQNKFSIDDIDGGRTPFTIEAGAPSHSLYVDDGGRVGFGTSTPVLDAHIVSGNTPSVRLEQNGSSGFSPQTWDIAGNETNFFIRDVTNGSKLPFRIFPGAPSSSLIIQADGKVGIGTQSPLTNMELQTTGEHAVLIVERTDGATAQIAGRLDKTMIGSRTNHNLNLSVNNTPKMTVNTNGYVGIGTESPSYPLEVANANGAHVTTGGVWTNGSSKEFKENIKNLTTEEAMDALKGLNPVKYNYRLEKEEEYVGFIAEEVPELVAMNNKKYLSPMDVVAVLTKVVKEQQNTISELKEKVAELEKKSR